MKMNYSKLRFNIAQFLLTLGILFGFWMFPWIYLPTAIIIYVLTFIVTLVLEKKHNRNQYDYGTIIDSNEPRKSERLLREEIERRKNEEIKYANFIKKIRSPEYLKNMDPYEFEEFACKYFESVGYKVTRTLKSNDQGIDGILEKNGTKTIVQAKRVQSYVGQPIIRDLYGTMVSEKADSAFIVTTGKVSQQSRDWIEKDNKPIHIFTIEDLEEWLHQLQLKIPDDFVVNEEITPFCPRCKSKLIKKRAKKGFRKGKYFWGCSKYFETGCNYARPL